MTFFRNVKKALLVGARSLSAGFTGPQVVLFSANEVPVDVVGVYLGPV